jgi:hypothetical protein
MELTGRAIHFAGFGSRRRGERRTSTLPFENKRTALGDGGPVGERSHVWADVPHPHGVVPARGDHARPGRAERWHLLGARRHGPVPSARDLRDRHRPGAKAQGLQPAWQRSEPFQRDTGTITSQREVGQRSCQSCNEPSARELPTRVVSVRRDPTLPCRCAGAEVGELALAIAATGPGARGPRAGAP